METSSEDIETENIIENMVEDFDDDFDDEINNEVFSEIEIKKFTIMNQLKSQKLVNWKLRKKN